MQSQAPGRRSSALGSTQAKGLAIVMAVGLFLVLLAPIAFADCQLTDPACSADQATETVTGTAGDAGDAVDGTVNPVKDKADAAVEQVTDTVNGILHPGGGPTPTPTPSGGGGRGSGGDSGPNAGRGATPGFPSGVGAVNRETIPGATTATSLPVIDLSLLFASVRSHATANAMRSRLRAGALQGSLGFHHPRLHFCKTPD